VNVVRVRTLAGRWKASRVDVAQGTMQTYDVALGRILPRLGATAADTLDAQTIADMVAELHADGRKKQTIRKTVSVLAMVLDHARIEPNPARDRLTVKMPREENAKCSLLPPTTSKPSYGYSQQNTGCQCLCSTRPACGSASSRRSPGRHGRAARPLADRDVGDGTAAVGDAAVDSLCRGAGSLRPRRPPR